MWLRPGLTLFVSPSPGSGLHSCALHRQLHGCTHTQPSCEVWHLRTRFEEPGPSPAGSSIETPGAALQILVVLLEHPGEIVAREDIRQQLWPTDTFVDFNNSVNAASPVAMARGSSLCIEGRILSLYGAHVSQSEANTKTGRGGPPVPRTAWPPPVATAQISVLVSEIIRINWNQQVGMRMPSDEPVANDQSFRADSRCCHQHPAGVDRNKAV